MKAITLSPEWAYAVTHLGKDVENRTWWPPKGYTGDLAIHAGQRYNPSAVAFIVNLGLVLPARAELPTGVVVSVVTVARHHDGDVCVCSCSQWAMNPPAGGKPIYHWPVAGVRVLTPVPVLGRLGWWELPKAVNVAVHTQLAEVAR